MKDKKNNEEPEESELKPEVETESTKKAESTDTRIAELEKQLEDEHNTKLMIFADFQNYKKRQENEKNDYRIFATKLITGQLMQIVDDFSRASEDIRDQLKECKANEGVQKSLQTILDKIGFVINQNGYEEIEIKVGDKFEPTIMEAVTSVPLSEADKAKDNTVIHIDQKGFRHVESGIVFKTAKVIIGKFNK
jgi:molecular chaperone GrpE